MGAAVSLFHEVETATSGFAHGKSSSKCEKKVAVGLSGNAA